jgi:hypothetical protein
MKRESVAMEILHTNEQLNFTITNFLYLQPSLYKFKHLKESRAHEFMPEILVIFMHNADGDTWQLNKTNESRYLITMDLFVAILNDGYDINITLLL